MLESEIALIAAQSGNQTSINVQLVPVIWPRTMAAIPNREDSELTYSNFGSVAMLPDETPYQAAGVDDNDGVHSHSEALWLPASIEGTSPFSTNQPIAWYNSESNRSLISTDPLPDFPWYTNQISEDQSGACDEHQETVLSELRFLTMLDDDTQSRSQRLKAMGQHAMFSLPGDDQQTQTIIPAAPMQKKR